MTNEQKYRKAKKQYRENMTDEQKQKLKDYRREHYKKYYAAKKLNNKTNYCEIIDHAAKRLNNKTIDSEIIDDDSDEDNGYDSDNENDS